MIKRITLTLLLVCLMVWTAACSENSKADDSGKEGKAANAADAGNKDGKEGKKPRVAFVYIGVPGDGGWTYQHDQGRLMMEKQLGIKSTVIENVPEGPDAERVFEELAKKNDIIFGTSFGYMDAMVNVAKKYPKVKFVHNTGYKTSDNLATYMGREYQSYYLVGIAAGKLTKNNQIGYVGAFPIPEVIYSINAFTLGAQSVNPDVKVSVVWSNTWFDPSTERQAAVSLLDKGVDVLAAYQDSSAGIQAAAEKGVWGIGNDSDMSRFAPDTYITNNVWNWGPYYIKAVQSVMDGTWKSESYWGPMSDGVMDLAPFGKKVPKEVQDLVESKKKEMLAGTLSVFKGPLADQGGKVRAAEGEELKDEDILNMNWFVKGIKGTIKN